MITANLFDKSIYVDPYAMFALWRAESPVVYDEGRNTFALCLHSDVMMAFRDQETFTSSKGARANAIPQPFMIDADDPHHREQRKIVERAFTPGKVALHEGKLTQIAQNIVESLPDGEEIDLVEHLTHKLPVITVANILGVPDSDIPMLQKWGEDMVEGADGWENVTDSVVSAVISWFDYFDEYAKFKKMRSDDDLISILLRAHYENGEITYEEARGNALALLVGGNETARYLITGGLYEVLTRQSIWDAIRSDKTAPQGLIEECVRWVSPAVSSIRHTTKDISVRGVVIPADSQVMLMLPSANRDENIFDRPEEFNPQRPKNQNVGFGFGVHYCIGSNLAKMQLKIVLETLAKFRPNLQLADNFQPDIKASTFLRGIRALPARPGAPNF